MTISNPCNLDRLRVDLVGSLLRPGKLKEIFARYAEGRATDEELRRAQDEAVRDVTGKQEAHNLPILTDGEFRRTSFMESFSVVAGVEDWQTGVKTYHQVPRAQGYE